MGGASIASADLHLVPGATFISHGGPFEVSIPSRRIGVLRGHLKPGLSCAGGVRANSRGAGSKVAPQSSAPMSSNIDEFEVPLRRPLFQAEVSLMEMI